MKDYIIAASGFFGSGILSRAIYRLFQLRFYLTLLIVPPDKKRPTTVEDLKFVKLSFISPWRYQIIIADLKHLDFIKFNQLAKALA